jgi:hypothetical protein
MAVKKKTKEALVENKVDVTEPVNVEEQSNCNIESRDGMVVAHPPKNKTATKKKFRGIKKVSEQDTDDTVIETTHSDPKLISASNVDGTVVLTTKEDPAKDPPAKKKTVKLKPVYNKETGTLSMEAVED